MWWSIIIGIGDGELEDKDILELECVYVVVGKVWNDLEELISVWMEP